MKKSQHRRTFLKQLFTGSMATLALPALGDTLVNSSEELATSLSGNRFVPADEAYWDLVKRQFAVPENLIMMNAANLCPSPYFVTEKVLATQTQLSKDVSFQYRLRFSETRKKSISQLAEFIGASSEEIGITRNTTEANSIVVTGIDMKAGDEVVIWDQNHPSNGVAWEQRAKRAGFTVKKISIPFVLLICEKAISFVLGVIALLKI